MNTEESAVREPPRRLGGIVRHLGPGLILAGSIVGSGELIAATRTGAEAGFIFLGLIIFGCVVKVFTQVEIARHCVTTGETTLTALNQVPGPRAQTGKGVVNWIVIFWIATMLCGLGQLGGIVGGVGQAMAMSVPLTAKGAEYNTKATARAKALVLEKQLAEDESVELAKLKASFSGYDFEDKPVDDKLWALLLAGITSVMLFRGGFGFIESFCTILVGSFSLVTIANLLALQTHGDWAIRPDDLREGLGLGFLSSGSAKLGLALSTFGIIGVGASEIVAYPYWCLEKGYGKWIGRDDNSPSWTERARGWLRVMQWDAWGSMVVYTFCTIVFYLLGAAVLSRLGLVPEKADLVRTLSVMYAPAFGQSATYIFLFGAFAVLFSTFLVSNAGKARMFVDVTKVTGFTDLTEERRQRWVSRMGAALPLICVLVYVVWPSPAKLILFSGMMQSLLLPMLAFGALWFRRRQPNPELRPGRAWDFGLGFSFLAFVAIGLYLAVTKSAALMAIFSDYFGR